MLDKFVVQQTLGSTAEACHNAFAEKLKALEKARAEIADLPNKPRRRLAKLEAEREMRQRHWTKASMDAEDGDGRVTAQTFFRFVSPSLVPYRSSQALGSKAEYRMEILS
ncbi:hypothetical protein NKDENANG_01028 [Candidatus Entotheonellaceae bacterium PAL068K]